MSPSKHLWLRAESKPFEHRSALTPVTAKALLDAGFQITVEKSTQRCFLDEEFSCIGCTLAQEFSWPQAPADAYILALKELPENENFPLHHTHIYFAHCFKYQPDWKKVLERFRQGNGTLLDLEFLQNEQGKRVASFGHMAGFVDVP
uniref:Alanine dehydrogenase/pyridine nucleotide transhydrogenase N-terminal domain-containing protein n=1 Tax=Ditylenchus dipsaci TaxID=166011 RepID=A0A915CVZ8_9BILA